MPGQLRSILIQSITALLIFLFVYTAISKMITHDLFLAVLGRSPLLKNFSVAVSWLGPLTELMIAATLFIPSTRRTGLIFSGLLMTVFTAYIGYMILFMPHLPCTCGGVLQGLSWRQHLVFNIFFTLLAFTGWRLSTINKDFIAINRISRTPVENSRLNFKTKNSV